MRGSVQIPPLEPPLKLTPWTGWRGNAGRWNAHTGLQLFLVAVILVLSGAIVHRWRAKTTPAIFIADTYRAPFQVGDAAPDFALPDRTGKTRRLSELVDRQTLLWFTCGCSRCREMQALMGRLARRLGQKAPQVVSVTTGLPEAEEAYRRDTRLDQVVLYAPGESAVYREYRGHPCPRVFGLKADRTVAWIGPSPASTSPEEEGFFLARALGIDRADAAREYQAVLSALR